MKLIKLVLIAFIALFSAGCAAFLGEPGSAESMAGGAQKASSAGQFQELEDWLIRNNLSITAGRDGNDFERSFSQGAVIVYGEGTPSSSMTNPAQ